MEEVTSVVHLAVELPLRLFDRAPGWVSLTLLSALSGVVILVLVGRLTDQRRLLRARDQMASAIYEMRLYLDSPVRILKAQGRFARWSLWYFVLTLPPLFVMIVPLSLLFLHLEARFELAPIAPGEQALLVLRFAEAVEKSDVAIVEQRGLRVTAPPMVDGSTAYLRVRADAPGEGLLVVEASGERVEKVVVVGEGPSRPDRAAGWRAFLAHGLERPLPADGKLREIQVLHERVPYEIAGMPWWLYFLLVATGAAMLLKEPMGVVL